MRVRATRGHRIPDRLSLALARGDEVVIGTRSPDWPAFVFVTAEHGEGWVPERHFTSDRPHAVTVTQYDTTELAVDPGDILTVIDRDDESGWWWCEAEPGSAGWVPVEALNVEDT